MCRGILSVSRRTKPWVQRRARGVGCWLHTVSLRAGNGETGENYFVKKIKKVFQQDTNLPCGGAQGKLCATPSPSPSRDGNISVADCIPIASHSLTHYSRPSSMRVGDSRWPLRYLSYPLCSARSCDISFSWLYSQPVHSSMSCIHCLLGLSWCRNPSMIPSMTVSANCPALPRVMLQETRATLQ